MAVVLVLGALVAAAFAAAPREQLLSLFSLESSTGADSPITAVARSTTMAYEVQAGGELQSADAVEIVCEVEGQQLKIVEMLPEGTHVRQGQVVLRLDPSQIGDRLAQQQIKVTQLAAAAKAAAEELKIQKNVAASEVAKAKLALSLAQLDLKKYLQGEYQIELNNLQGSIALAETDLQEANDVVSHFQMLVKKGFRSPEQLQAKEQSVERAKYMLSRDREKLQVLKNFIRERQEVELTAKAEEAVRELERSKSSAAALISKAETDLQVAEATAQLERNQLEKTEKQLELCDVRAPADGTLVYAKDKNKKIELGASVHFKQTLFGLPNMASMQVEAFVHESEIKKVQEGMPAVIQVDAFPDVALRGRVTAVATFYDATRHWLSGGTKEYATTVLIEDLPEGIALKPGMTAQTRIRVGELSDGVIVPLAAVAQQDKTYYCYVATTDGIERREVVLGENTANYVEVLSGVDAGQRVALDARARLDMEQDQQSGESALAQPVAAM